MSSIYFIKFKIKKKNIYFSLLDSNFNIIFSKSIKWFLKFKNMDKPRLRRYSFKMLNSFFFYFFDLVYSFDRKGKYILVIDSLNKFFSTFFINFIVFQQRSRRLKHHFIKIIFLNKQSHGFMRKRKIRRL